MADSVKEVEVISAQVTMRAYEGTATPVLEAYLRAQELLQQAHRSLIAEAEQRIDRNARELMPMLDGAGEGLARAAGDFRELLQTGAAARQQALFERFGAALAKVAMQDASAAADLTGAVRRASAVQEKIISSED
jgi:hypothetical protein